MVIQPYITFNGNCREAMTFYKECLGGDLTFQTIGESPGTESIPIKMKEFILNARLAKSNFTLMASDIVSELGLVHGNSISLILHCNDENEIMNCYNKLSSEGKKMQSIQKNHWGALSGDLIDKFGVQWILYYLPVK